MRGSLVLQTVHDFQNTFLHICNCNAFLFHAVAMTQCNSVIFQSLVINSDTNRCADFIMSAIVFTDVSRIFQFDTANRQFAQIVFKCLKYLRYSAQNCTAFFYIIIKFRY